MNIYNYGQSYYIKNGSLNDINSSLKNICNTIYPVGSIYISVNNTNPFAYFGGTWVSWGSGRVPVSVNTSDSNFSTVEKTGGSSTHTHTNSSTGAASGNTGSTTLNINQIPSHNHTFTAEFGASPNIDYNPGKQTYMQATGTSAPSRANISTIIGSNGGSQGHTHTLNNHTHSMSSTGSSSTLQPYITCYMWKRTE